MAGPVIKGENYRISVLTESLVRLEYSEDGVFEDGQTQVVQNRDFVPVACEVLETEAVVDLHTEHLHLHFEKGPFAPDRLYIELKGQYAVYGSRWHYGDQPETLKGTSRTLDEVDGAMELQDGILSKAGYALLDDSASYLYDDESGFRARSYPEVDLYFFGYGRDYLGALKDFYHLTGQPPTLATLCSGKLVESLLALYQSGVYRFDGSFQSRRGASSSQCDRYGLAQDGDSCSLWKWLDGL